MMDTKDEPAHRRRLLVEAIANHPYVTAGAALLAAVASVVTIVQVVGDDPTSATTPVEKFSQVNELDVSAGAFDSGVTNFLVPLSTQMEDFPWQANPGCTPEQRDWLAERGAERQTDWLVEVRSTAQGGNSQIALRNVRLRGDFDDASGDSAFLFKCPSAGMADFVEVQQPVEQNVNATLFEDGSPFAINLEPGEIVQLRVFMTGSGGVTGSLVAEVASGRADGVAELIPTLDLPSLGAGNMYVTVGSDPDTFYCATLDHDIQERCTAQEIPLFAAEFAKLD